MSTALVTGASSGLGVELARHLASRGFDLALTARSSAPMEALAEEIQRTYGVSVSVHPLDLSQPGGADVLIKDLDQHGISLQVLVLNAGFGLSGPFLDQDPARLTAMLQLNVVALTELAQRIGRRMADQGGGKILLVASMAAFLPSPLLAVYAASKAYVLSLGEALNVELSPAINVTVLSPGLMDTGFNSASGYEASEKMRRSVLSTPAVAKIGLDALFAGRSSVVAGRRNALTAGMTRLFSRHGIARRLYRMKSGG